MTEFRVTCALYLDDQRVDLARTRVVQVLRDLLETRQITYFVIKDVQPTSEGN